MTVWTVFEPETADEARSTTAWAEGFVFVPEKLSWSAIPFAALVLLRHGLWLGMIVYLVVQALIFGAVVLLELDSDAFALMLIPNLLVAVELSGLRRAKLAARGYEEAGTVVAPNRDAAEQRYFEACLGSHVPAAPLARAMRCPPVRPVEAGVLGLFPEARR